MKHKKRDPKILIIGAGVGGLACAAILSKAGMDLTVLEAQTYPGGCASTFFHKGYRFDAGATLAAGFYEGGPMDLLAQAVGIKAWPIHYDKPAMVVHLPDGQQIACHNQDNRWEEYQAAFGEKSLDFFQWQEKTAGLLWRFALRTPSWPIKSVRDILSIIGALDTKLLANSPKFMLDVFRPIGSKLKNIPENMRLFIDGQLLISAQTTSEYANALYSASALDLPRRGVAHLANGIGGLATILVDTIRTNGGKVNFRQEVIKIRAGEHQFLIETKKKETYQADIIIANLTPWNIADLMQEKLPDILQKLRKFPVENWGAFTLYLGVNEDCIPKDFPLHHQIIRRKPLAEGNSLFVSISPEWDLNRAPRGKRAITISTHTRLKQWWDLFENDLPAYEHKRNNMVEIIIEGLGTIFPNIRAASDLILPGTPITFQRYTGRKFGWVGGFPQISLFQTFHPRIADNFWMVGDSIFPGQSTAAVALGAMRVSREIMREMK